MISFVIPCYNSEKTILAVIDEISSVMRMREGAYDYEVVAVNDCSPDKVLEVLRDRAARDPHLRVASLAGNVGKHAAVLAGYSLAAGDYVVSVDDDGQCPIEHLWELIAPLERGHDMAMADYGVKQQTPLKRFGSAMNHQMSHLLLGKPKNVVFSNFIARTKVVCKSMATYKNAFPYLEGLSLRITTDIVMVPMEERPRRVGQSNFTFSKSLALWVNGFTAFSAKPLRVGALLGGVLSLLAVAMGLFSIVCKLINPGVSSGYRSLTIVILLCAGLIMLQLGLLGEYIGRIFISVNQYPQYVIKEKINF
ncbi:glycosyltransferase [Olsenella phocaeensis]|uniref:glycosyltransferase n=1 Tax=Olsenella phocaeensis TaxID=1852385 RepID=UPI000931BC81|nr:glycosyltransferase [Olsenella phocaeensis]